MEDSVTFDIQDNIEYRNQGNCWYRFPYFIILKL